MIKTSLILEKYTEFNKEEIVMFRKAYNAAARRAKDKGLRFKISIDDILTRYISQSGLCHYSGLKMKIIKSGKELHDPYKMTIDCLDSTRGYTKNNFVLCLYCINSFKQKMPRDEVIKICRSIMKYNEEN